MGIVYRAVRIDDHYLKHVAIKVVRTGFATDHYLRRFRNERQIMASLEHPNIARLLDGGATEADATNAGALADLADSFARLGALNLSEGWNQDLPVQPRKRRLNSARSWYQESLKVWLDMRKRGILSGVLSQSPDQVAAELAKCETALSALKNPTAVASEKIWRSR